jgi:glucan biosynthesis protein C
MLLPALPLILYLTVLLPRFEATNDLLHDWFQHAQFFTVFVFGYWLGRDERIWDELARLRWPLLAVSLLCFAVYLPLIRTLPDDAGEGVLFAVRSLRGVYVWTTLAAILGLGRAYLNRPFRWLPYATEAVFPWYVLHQTVIVVIAYWLVPLRVGPVLEPVIVVLGTVFACYALNEFVISRIAVLRPLFGLKWRRVPAPPVQPAVEKNLQDASTSVP